MASPTTPKLRVLWVDPNITLDSPSMKNAVRALPILQARGVEVELCCLRCEAPEGTRVHRLPAAPWMGGLENVWFVLVANVWFLWRSMVTGGRPADLTYTTGAYCLFAEVVHMHFDSAAWLREQAAAGIHGWRVRLRRLQTRLGAWLERLSGRSPWGRLYIAVSEGLAASIRSGVASGKRVKVLPNPCDLARFHPGVRGLHRQTVRAEFGLPDSATVVLFAATGHLERKGFWSVLRVLARLRRQGHASLRLLAVGGGEALWGRVRATLERECPDHALWVQTVPYARDIERYYGAADAFFFPSRFETYALVAQEAAACGLRLWVTPYWGQEMYLQSGVNGRLLPWDEAGMEAVVGEDLAARPWPSPSSPALLDTAAYGERLARLFQETAFSAA